MAEKEMTFFVWVDRKLAAKHVLTETRWLAMRHVIDLELEALCLLSDKVSIGIECEGVVVTASLK